MLELTRARARAGRIFVDSVDEFVERLTALTVANTFYETSEEHGGAERVAEV